MILKLAARAALPLALLAGLASLAACRDEPAPAPPPAAEPAAVAEPAPAAAPAPTEPSRVRVLSSTEAPFACDVLTDADLAPILGKDVEILDVTEQRRKYGMSVESACLFAFGENRDPEKINLDSKFVRVDIYTDAAFRAAGHGALEDQWRYRVRDGSTVFHLHDTALAAWVESEHPPDPALIVRQGEVMYDLAYYPATSNPGNPERNAPIEEIARLFLSKLEAGDQAGK